MISTGEGGRAELSFTSVEETIGGILDDLRAMRQEENFSKTLGASAVEGIRRGESDLRKRLSGPFLLVVAGDFKRGKSTLINALLGRRVVPTSVTPETATINHLSYGAVPSVRALLKNGRQVALSREDLTRSRLAEVMRQLPAEIDRVEVCEDVELLKQLSIVDTPGVGELLREFDERVAQVLARADAIVYVVSAKAPLSLTEQQFLSACVVPNSFSRLLVALNLSDCLETPENISKIKNLVSERVRLFYPNSEVFAVSALDEICRIEGLDRPEPDLSEDLEHGFEALRSALECDILMQRDIIRAGRCVAMARALLRDLEARVRLTRNSFEAGREQLTASRVEFERQNTALMDSMEHRRAALAADVSQMKGEARDWMNGFMARFKEEILGLRNTAEVAQLERYFQFYLADLVKSALLACVQRHRRDLADRLETEAKSFAGELSQAVFGGISAQIGDCIADISWTGVDATLFAANIVSAQIPELAGIMILGQAIAGFVRQRVIKERQKDFLGPVLEGFDLLVVSVQEQVGAVYDQLRKEAEDKLAQLYQHQLELSRETIEQAEKTVSEESLRTEDVFRYLDSVGARLADMAELLEQYEQ